MSSLRRHLRHLRNRSLLLLAFLLLLAVAEWVAAVRDAHRPSSFLVRGVSDGRDVWVENQFFPTRFATPRVAEPPPPVSALRERLPGSIRVCVLADSAALGLGPSGPAFSFPRHLEALLAARYPSRKVEVILLSAPSANSHILREIAEELHKLSPDAVLFICANDEITGPYGPASALGGFHHSSRIARALVLLSRTHLSRAFGALSQRLFPNGVDRAIWSAREPVMMKGLVPDSSPALAAARRSYARNVSAILRSARRAAPVVLACTTPVNLRSCSPFVTPYLADGSLAQLNRRDLRAAAAAEAADPEAAEELYRDILARNPRHAEALFRLASLSLAAGDLDLARTLFRQAADADQMRLRAHSDFNGILRSLADDAGPRVSLFDAESILASASPSGIPGSEFFLDHVHLNFAGNYLLASALADALADASAIPPPEVSASVSEEELASLLLYSPWGQLDELNAALAEWIRPPFQNLSSQHAAVERLMAVRSALESKIAALSPDTTRAIYSRRLAARPDDPWLAIRAAAHCLDASDFHRAMDAASAALRFWPDRYDVRAVLVLSSILRHDLPAETAAALASASAAQADPARFAALSNALASASADARAAAKVAAEKENALKESLNASLLSWALSLRLDSVPLAASYPLALLQAVQSDNAALAESARIADAAAAERAAADADFDPVRKEFLRLSNVLVRAEAELDASRIALEKARDSVGDPAELAALIRSDSTAQSHVNAAQAALQIASRNLDAAQAAHDRAVSADAAARSTLEKARRSLSGNVRSLRQAYLAVRFPSEKSGDPPPPRAADPWGPPLPENLYADWKQAADRDAEAQRAETLARDTLQSQIDALESLRHDTALQIATAIRDENLPLLLGSLPNPAPFNVSRALFIARSLVRRDAPDLALPWLQYALAKDPDNADAAQALAEIYRSLNRYPDAIAVLQAALLRLPSNPVLWEDLGTLQCLSGDWGLANDSYERAEAIAPYRYDHLLKWARALISLREYRRALTPLRHYLDAVPKDPDALALLDEIALQFPDGLPAPPSAPKPSKPSLLDAL